MRNTFTAISLAMLWPSFTRAQAADAINHSGLGLSEKLMLFVFIVSAVIVFLIGKFAYDMIFKKKH